MNFERPKTPSPESEKPQETAESLLAFVDKWEKPKETVIPKSEYTGVDAEEVRQYREVDDRLEELKKKYLDAKLQLISAERSLTSILKERIKLKDKVRGMEGKEGLDGYHSEIDKTRLEKLEKSIELQEL